MIKSQNYRGGVDRMLNTYSFTDELQTSTLLSQQSFKRCNGKDWGTVYQRSDGIAIVK